MIESLWETPWTVLNRWLTPFRETTAILKTPFYLLQSPAYRADDTPSIHYVRSIGVILYLGYCVNQPVAVVRHQRAFLSLLQRNARRLHSQYSRRNSVLPLWWYTRYLNKYMLSISIYYDLPYGCFPINYCTDTFICGTNVCVKHQWKSFFFF